MSERLMTETDVEYEARRDGERERRITVAAVVSLILAIVATLALTSG